MAALPSKVAEFTGDETKRSRREPSVGLDEQDYETEEDDDKPEPLPLYQQRYNFYS